MKAIAVLLALSLLGGSSWAEPPMVEKQTAAENQVPFSFLPTENSIFSRSTLKPIQDLSKVQVIEETVVPASTTPPIQPAPSQVYGINRSQAKGLAGEIARFLATQQPAESTTIQLLPSKDRNQQAFDTLLEAALREQGFAVSRTTLPSAISLSYQVIRGKQEILVRLMMNQTEVSRLYRDDLVALTPFTRLNRGGQP